MGVIWTPTAVGAPIPTRKILTGRRDCITGYFPTPKAEPADQGEPEKRLVAYDGFDCRNVMAICDHDRGVKSFREEPPPILWEDGEGISHLYYPDIAVRMIDGRRICVEVKRAAKVKRTNFKEKFEHIRIAAQMAGYDEAELWSEKDIYAGARVANAMMLSFLSSNPFENLEAEHTVLMALMKLGGRASIATLRRMSGLKDQAYRSILKLIAQGKLTPVQTYKEIDDSTDVIVTKSNGAQHV